MGAKINEKLYQWLKLFLFFVIISVLRSTESALVDITFVHNAVKKGAVCLDGSPPAYNLDWGSGKGVNNWLVHIEGGGWCHNATTCIAKKNTIYGSSNLMEKKINFSGILSNDPQFNPDFYNWNRVKLRYCDGSSFTGDVEAVDPDTKLYYRGARVFDAVMKELLAKGLKCAKQAILSGCSSGGVATILHCDRFKALLHKTAKVKCLADAGFFINAPDISGTMHIQNYYNDLVTTHGSAKNLPKSCTSKMNSSLCFFAQNVLRGIQTPLFVLNSDIDSWQIHNILVPGVIDPSSIWLNCKFNFTKCSDSQLKTIIGFGEEFVKVFNGLGDSKTRGYFINSCHTHCQAEIEESWFTNNSPTLGNKRIGEAVGDWFFYRSSFQKIDCSYPCDKTCTSLS